MGMSNFCKGKDYVKFHLNFTRVKVPFKVRLKSISLLFFVFLTSICVVVVYWLSLLYSFIELSLNSGFAQVQTLLAGCRRFAMVKISENGPGWK